MPRIKEEVTPRKEHSHEKKISSVDKEDHTGEYLLKAATATVYNILTSPFAIIGHGVIDAIHGYNKTSEKVKSLAKEPGPIVNTVAAFAGVIGGIIGGLYGLIFEGIIETFKFEACVAQKLADRLNGVDKEGAKDSPENKRREIDSKFVAGNEQIARDGDFTTKNLANIKIAAVKAIETVHSYLGYDTGYEGIKYVAPRVDNAQQNSNKNSSQR
jgi:hypothetical protein